MHSIEPQQQPTKNGGSEEVAPFACSNCNKGHRKCDRKLPSCSYCVLTNKTCTFDRLPQKRGPKKEDSSKTRYKPYVINSSPTVGSLGDSNDKHIPRTLEGNETKFSFHHFQPQRNLANAKLFATNYMPNIQYQFHPDNATITTPHIQNTFQHSSNSSSVLQQRVNSNISPQQPQVSTLADKHFDQLFINSPSAERARAMAVYSTKHCLPTDPNLPRPNNDDMAIYYSMQAYFYKRLHMRLLASKCFEMSREFIGGGYDRVFQSYEIALSFTYLSLYLIDENENDRATFYLDNVNSFLKNSKIRQNQENLLDSHVRNLRDRLLRVLHATSVYLCNYSMDMTRIVKAIICVSFISKQHRLMNTTVEKQIKGEVVEYTDPTEFMQYLDLIVDDLENGSNSFKYLDIALLDRLSNKFRPSLTPSEQASLSETDSYMRRVQAVIIIQAAKIQVLQRQERYTDEATRRAADLIISLCTQSIMHMCHYAISQPLSLAMSIHLRCIEVSKDHDTKYRLVQDLKAGVKNMKILAERYRIIHIMYGTLVSNVEDKIAACEEEYRQLPERTQPSQLVEDLMERDIVKSETDEQFDVGLQRFLKELLEDLGNSAYEQVLFL